MLDLQNNLDKKYINIALNLAMRMVGKTAPNPAVGSVIVKDGTVVGIGATAQNGRPHAETIAIKMAGEQTKNADMYVSLEPCCHEGKTMPCTDAIIQSGIKRIVIACGDPNPIVSGNGIKKLKDSGIEVVSFIEEAAAKEINRGFFYTQLLKRPFITLKIATSLDGKIALQNGKSQWISGEISRKYAHMLRARNDAILIGSNTVKADNPDLTCRLKGLEKFSPVRVILSTKFDFDQNCKILTSPNAKSWIFTNQIIDKNAKFSPHVKIFNCNKNDEGFLDIKEIVTMLANNGITSLIIEGGAKIAAAFLTAQLIDEIVWIKAPIIIGNDGRSAISNLGFEELMQAYKFTSVDKFSLGHDSAEIFCISCHEQSV